MDASLKIILNELRRCLVELYGDRLARMILFGSRARSDVESGSDVDILVVLEGPVNPGEEIVQTGPSTAKLSLEYDLVISCTFVSADRFATEQSPLLLNVRREGIVV